ncbi:MAG: HD domain-containing protein [Sphaerochaetaceae bacterium]|nr:HD domain-containing protein [Sphaerochaetaceae bacterium]
MGKLCVLENNGLTNRELERRERERVEDIRGAYYRDTTAIIHSSPFRRLKHKTQVFFAPANDHICTRMEHSLHVASIAATICRPFKLDTELAWAIGLGHDLGHTPFGHVGERIIDEKSKEFGYGGFEHEINSLKVVTKLAANGNGLNLTYAVRDGIVSHCGEAFNERIRPTFKVKDFSKITTRKGLIPATWEATAVRFADSIAYLGRDYEDASRLGLLESHPLPDKISSVIGHTNAEIINTLVLDLIENTDPETGMGFSERTFEAIKLMKNFNYEFIYRSEILNSYTMYFKRLINFIIDYLLYIYDHYGFDKSGYDKEKNMVAAGFYSHLVEMQNIYKDADGNLEIKKMVLDYIAGMTDNFCSDCGREILSPDHLNDSIEISQMGRWFDKRKITF